MEEEERMSTARDSRTVGEAVWQAWLRKGGASEERTHGKRVKALAWLSLGGIGLAACAGFFTALAPYEVEIRFVVAGGAVAMMAHTLHRRRYATSFVFGALALLYNPVAPLFSFPGDWPSAVIGLTGLPFLTFLTTPHTEAANHA
jgi:hypothetical protein